MGLLMYITPEVGSSLTSLSPVLSRDPVVVLSAVASCMQSALFLESSRDRNFS